MVCVMCHAMSSHAASRRASGVTARAMECARYMVPYGTMACHLQTRLCRNVVACRVYHTSCRIVSCHAASFEASRSRRASRGAASARAPTSIGSAPSRTSSCSAARSPRCGEGRASGGVLRKGTRPLMTAKSNGRALLLCACRGGSRSSGAVLRKASHNN